MEFSITKPVASLAELYKTTHNRPGHIRYVGSPEEDGVSKSVPYVFDESRRWRQATSEEVQKGIETGKLRDQKRKVGISTGTDPIRAGFIYLWDDSVKEMIEDALSNRNNFTKKIMVRKGPYEVAESISEFPTSGNRYMDIRSVKADPSKTPRNVPYIPYVWNGVEWEEAPADLVEIEGQDVFKNFTKENFEDMLTGKTKAIWNNVNFQEALRRASGKRRFNGVLGSFSNYFKNFIPNQVISEKYLRQIQKIESRTSMGRKALGKEQTEKVFRGEANIAFSQMKRVVKAYLLRKFR